jgi:hypothetical protein
VCIAVSDYKMAHLMYHGQGGCVTQLPYKDALKHPVFKHYNPSVGAWATGQLISVTVPKLKVDVGYPVDGADSMPHPSGMDMAARQQTQADRDRMENDRQIYMHALQQQQQLATMQQQIQQQQLAEQDDDGDEYPDERQPASSRRRAVPKKSSRRVVRFTQDDGSDESSGEDEVDESVEPVRKSGKKVGGGKARPTKNRLGDQLNAAKTSKKKSSPY